MAEILYDDGDFTGDAAFGERVADFIDLVNNYEERDVRRNAFRLAVKDELDAHLEQPGASTLMQWTMDAMRFHPEMGASHCLTQVLRATSFVMLKWKDRFSNYPYAYTEPDTWRDSMHRIVADPEMGEELRYSIQERSLQSNVSKRYAGAVVTGQLLEVAGRLPIRTVLDVGCSMNTGLKHIASGLPFDQTHVVERDGVTRNLPVSNLFRSMLRGEWNVQESVGIELENPFEDDWARLISLNPTEILQKENVELLNELIRFDPPNVRMSIGDFIEDDNLRRELTLRYGIFKMGLIFTVLHTLSSSDRQQILSYMFEHADFVVSQDFAHINPDRPEVLDLRSIWNGTGSRDFTYRTYLMDVERQRSRTAQADERGWSELLLWRDGRMGEVVLGAGRIRSAEDSPFNGDSVTVTEIINHMLETKYEPR